MQVGLFLLWSIEARKVKFTSILFKNSILFGNTKISPLYFDFLVANN